MYPFSKFFFPICLLAVVACNQKESLIDEYYISGYDLPPNEGVRNVLLNADLITGCQYTTTQRLRAFDTYESGTPITGIVYSSSRYEDLMCPNNVSLWTYLTAVSDPFSYLYTIDLSEPPYSLRGLARSFYGVSCSSFVRYSLGIKYSFQIHQMTLWDDFDIVFPNDVNSLELGDMLTSEQEIHTRLVTGIYREGNKVVSVEISEGRTPVARKNEYSAKSIQYQLKKKGYQIFRYKDIANVKHPPFPYDFNNSDEYYANSIIMPKRGDKANWRNNEDVIIDVLDNKHYSTYRIYRDDDLFIESSFPNGESEINLGILPIGDYRMVVIDGNNEIYPVYWIVVDYHIDVKPIGSGKVSVSFESSNATPIFLTWRRPWSYNISNNNMPQWTTVIDENALKDGNIVSILDPYLSETIGLGDWDFKVAFETKYGIISSDNISVFVQ